MKKISSLVLLIAITVILVAGNYLLFRTITSRQPIVPPKLIEYATEGVLPAPTLSSRPYVPLFVQVATDSSTDARAKNNETWVDRLRTWYVHVNGGGSNGFPFGEGTKTSPTDTTLAKKLEEAGLWVSQYRNGSYVSQSGRGKINFTEAQNLEETAALSIATYWPGDTRQSGSANPNVAKLTEGLDTVSTTVRVTSAASQKPTPDQDDPVPIPNTWPYVNSRGTGLAAGVFSQNTRDFVSWVRVDDEIMQIVGEPVETGGVVTLNVRRGIFGTIPSAHSVQARVMSPVYIGYKRNLVDTNLAGSPYVNNPDKPLRYGVKIWQPGGYSWIISRIQETFGSDFQGYNAVWLDVSSCNQYNFADPYGYAVVSWDDPHSIKMNLSNWGAYQRVKLDALRAAFPGKKFTGNSMFKFDSCNEDLLANRYDAGVLEFWLDTNDNWEQAMMQNFRIQIGNWPAIYWAKRGGTSYTRFTYGSLLLAYRPTATRFQYGRSSRTLDKPADLFFWDFGAPMNLSSGIPDVAVPGTLGLYKREFENGLVLVNPTGNAINYNLGQEYYRVAYAAPPNDSLDGEPQLVSSVSVQPRDAVFLLNATTDITPTATPIPTQTQTPTPSPTPPFITPTPTPTPIATPTPTSPITPTPLVGSGPAQCPTPLGGPSADRTLTIQTRVAGIGGGWVTDVECYIYCTKEGGRCSKKIVPGWPYTLKATPDSSSEFDTWIPAGACSDPRSTQCRKTDVRSNVLVTAVFKRKVGTGLMGNYYMIDNFSGFTNRVDNELNFDWRLGGPGVEGIAADRFGVVWVGSLEVAQTGAYTFFTQSDDGVQLWIDGRLLINNWDRHALTEDSAGITLTSGRHSIKLNYFDDNYRSVIKLLWSGPSIPKSVIPQNVLFLP